MTEEEFAAFRAAFVDAWADDLQEVEGIDRENAVRRAGAGLDGTLTGGIATPGQSLCVVLAGEEPIGTVWFSDHGEGQLHVSDIAIDEPHRGRGHGRRVLELVEEEAVRGGARGVGLNVYLHNPRARALYERLGYRPVSLNMRKPLG